MDHSTGGFLSPVASKHAPSKFSRETQDLLKTLIKESKLSTEYRNQLSKCVKDGRPLELHRRKPSPQKTSTKDVRQVQPDRGRRTLQNIIQSGAFDTRPTINSGPKPRNRTREKQELQNLMAYGAVTEPTKKVDEVPPVEIDRFEELVHEIEERREFLADMEQLGEGHRYRQMINGEIADKIREMEAIDKERKKITEK